MEEVGKILPTIFRKHMRREDARVVEVLRPLWFRVAGRGIAERSKPIAFVTGTLTLGALCPSWAAQLRCMAEEIRAEINNFLGCPVVKTVQVRLVQNLERVEPWILRDESPSVEVRKCDAAVRITKVDPQAVQILKGAKAKATRRGAERLDSWR